MGFVFRLRAALVRIRLIQRDQIAVAKTEDDFAVARQRGLRACWLQADDVGICAGSDIEVEFQLPIVSVENKINTRINVSRTCSCFKTRYNMLKAWWLVWRKREINSGSSAKGGIRNAAWRTALGEELSHDAAVRRHQAVVPVRRGSSRWKNFSGATPTATLALGLNGSSGALGPGMLASMGGDLRTGAWPS
jgi:hypothetical protein